MSEQKKSSMAKDVFSYLLMIVVLIMGIISFVTILFNTINHSFPDVLTDQYNNNADAIRTSISMIMIAWPVFILLSWMIGKDLLKFKDKADIWVRKWLLYFALFVSALAVIVDLITLMNYFLNGEITTRFILKVLVVLVVAVAIFWYYLWDLKRNTTEKSPWPRFAATLSSVVIVAAIVGGFFVIGTPAKQRMIRLDSQRVSDLMNIQWQVVSFWQETEVLPKELADLSDSISGFKAPLDVVTGQQYEYRILGDFNFELCATFDSENLDNVGSDSYRYMGGISTPIPAKYGVDNWNHTAGRVCFERTIDPDLYSKN